MRGVFAAIYLFLAAFALISCGAQSQADISANSNATYAKLAPHPSRYHPKAKGWTFVWGDEFESDILDRGKWEPEVSCWGGGNNERQCYTDRPENIQIKDGVLKLIARPEVFTGPKLPQGFEDRGPRVTQDYTSGKIRTRGKASWKYGRISARIKLPKGQSTWPAFWMMPADDTYGGWPLSGEIDIMEAVNLGAICSDCDDSLRELITGGALHFGKKWPDNEYITQGRALANLEAIDDFHEFALEWGEGRISWFVDGEKFFSAAAGDWFTASASTSENPNAPFDEAFYVMLNLAVGGNSVDNKNEKKFNKTSFPNELWVDWVRVYQCKTDKDTGLNCLSE